jgi:hypothetical protein
MVGDTGVASCKPMRGSAEVAASGDLVLGILK